MSVVALAGGVGGAKLADGLAAVLPPGDLTVIVNTGDDFEHFGLYICPERFNCWTARLGSNWVILIWELIWNAPADCRQGSI